MKLILKQNQKSKITPDPHSTHSTMSSARIIVDLYNITAQTRSSSELISDTIPPCNFYTPHHCPHTCLSPPLPLLCSSYNTSSLATLSYAFSRPKDIAAPFDLLYNSRSTNSQERSHRKTQIKKHHNVTC